MGQLYPDHLLFSMGDNRDDMGTEIGITIDHECLSKVRDHMARGDLCHQEMEGIMIIPHHNSRISLQLDHGAMEGIKALTTKVGKVVITIHPLSRETGATILLLHLHLHLHIMVELIGKVVVVMLTTRITRGKEDSKVITHPRITLGKEDIKVITHLRLTRGKEDSKVITHPLANLELTEVDIEVRRRRELQLKVPVVLRRIGIEACFNQMMVNVLSVLLICIFMPREVGMFKI